MALPLNLGLASKHLAGGGYLVELDSIYTENPGHRMAPSRPYSEEDEGHWYHNFGHLPIQLENLQPVAHSHVSLSALLLTPLK